MAIELVSDSSIVQWLGTGLIAMLVWTASGTLKKLDSLAKKFDELAEVIRHVEQDLRGGLAELDRRTTKLEAWREVHRTEYRRSLVNPNEPAESDI